MRAIALPRFPCRLLGAGLMLLPLHGCAEKPGRVVQVEVTVADGPAYRKVIEKHRGKVVLVDFWATWCAPCTRLFPHVVELGRKLAKDGLAIVSVSMDDPGKKDDVLAFLRKEGAEFDNLVSEFGTGTRTADEFEVRGDVPLYKLYDRAGKLRFQLSAEPEGLDLGESIDRVDEMVTGLLAER